MDLLFPLKLKKPSELVKWNQSVCQKLVTKQSSKVSTKVKSIPIRSVGVSDEFSYLFFTQYLNHKKIFLHKSYLNLRLTYILIK